MSAENARMGFAVAAAVSAALNARFVATSKIEIDIDESVYHCIKR
jgi:hypothetical protein